MNPRELKFLTVAAIVAMGLGLAGCGGGGGGDTAEATPPVVTPEPEPAPPSDLETTQAAAMAAAEAAKMASDAAAMSASDASDAVANLATAQTNAMSMSQTDAAQMQAKAAMDAYMAAKAASDAAAAAEGIDAAVTAKNEAVAAQGDAEAAAEMAKKYGDMAMESAMMELKIDGTMKTVGETTLDAGMANNVSTTGSGATEQKVETGLISSVTTTGPATYGRAAVDEDPTSAAPTARYKSPRVNAAARTDLKIGKEVDSADDTARLTIITAYASEQTVRVYAVDNSVTTGDIVLTVAADGTKSTTTGGTADETAKTLTPVGMFYHAENGEAANGITPGADAAALEPLGRTDADPPVQQGDTVMAGTKPVQVYSISGGGHAILVSTTTTEGGSTEQTYRPVDVHDEVNRDGLTGDEMVHVTAKLPAAKDYSHVHFGVWASLGEAAKSGAQKITDLGIGFVQSIGDGLSGSDMPNTGTATYNGNWAAAVQDATGALNLRDGAASISANLNKSEITATLTGLATLSGDISGNTFSGTKASKISDMHGLDTAATFTGSFDGGFYGAKAAEAAAIFDFTSTNGGAFRGAFGGAKPPPPN